MARLGQPSNRPRKVPVLIGVVAAAAVGTSVVLQQLPTEPTAPKPMAGVSVVVLDVFGDGFEGAGGGAPVPPVCPAPPAGFTRVTMDWAHRWAWGYPCGRMALCERDLRTYPQGQSYPAPIGANKGTYVVTPFVPRVESVNLYFDQVQSRPQIGYNQRPAEGMLLTVSKCPGQFTGLPPGCAIYGNSGALAWSTTPRPNLCTVTAGETWYLNVIAADPRGGIVPGEHSCEPVSSTAAGCDVGARISKGLP